MSNNTELKPLRKRIADAIKILKGEPLPIDLAPMPKITTSQCDVKTIGVRILYGEQYIYGYTPKEIIRQRAESELAFELAKALHREGVIQFREDDIEPALHARLRVVVPAEGE